ncbi:hypothetical protein Voc01_046470 [Virgisporangium ochraceum]|uniref:Uncharacterized protein n=1 Tax=Virgisporangium ochraceum TaxID=65505 RepID=A0A8J4EBT7_9ACTN|nr:hypothetical protein Voc01_046470 [Virgisporangium ochraceum]
MKVDPEDVSVRVVDPAGWPWTVHRRWLPWRPRVHRAVVALYSPLDGDDEPNFVTGLLLNIPCALLLPVLLVEWALLLAFLPFAVPVRLLGRRWTVAAHGRRDDGMRVRYEARASAARALRDTAADEIRADGAPRSLGAPVVVRVPADDATDLLRNRLRDGGEVTVACQVQGFGAAKSRDGWIEGRLTAVPGLLSFQPGGGLLPAAWPLLGSDDPHLALAGRPDRAAVGLRVVASYATPVGGFRVAVEPHLGPLLRDLLAAGAEPWPVGVAWAMWRQDAAGEVREIARFGSRADAELLAENLAARGSRQSFWLAAARH